MMMLIDNGSEDNDYEDDDYGDTLYDENNLMWYPIVL